MSNRFPDIHAHALQVPMEPGGKWLCFHCKREFKKPRSNRMCSVDAFKPGENIFIAAAVPCVPEDTHELH